MRTLLVLAFLMASLAGCSGTDDGGPAAEPTVITDPRDLAASNSTGEHVHDYWGGASSLEVMDTTQAAGWNNLGGPYNHRVLFSPPDEAVVPQGTASLAVGVDWTDGNPANRYGEVSLWVKPANSAEPRFIQEVTRGTTIEIPLLYNESDLPHQLISNWQFIVQYNTTGAQGTTYNLFEGRAHVTVVAHRGLELQPFPAHPDRWLGRPSFQLLNVTDHMSNIGYIGSGDNPARFRPENGSLVPSDAAYVEVILRLANDLPAGGLQLSFHPADARNFTALEPEADQGEVLRYTIQVEPGMGDGPYNDASLWEFQVYTQSSDVGNDPAVYQGTFELSATVHKQ